MTLEQLRIFAAVARREHMTRAAEALRLTQSAVSAAIASLEAAHGVILFDRIGRGITLTAEGRLFLNEAEAVLARAAAAENALKDMAGLARGRLHVEASQTIASYWLPRRIAAFRQVHPGITLTLGMGNTASVAAAIAAHRADLGFIEGRIGDHGLVAHRIGIDRLIVVAPPGHALAQRRRVTGAQLLRGEWVLREQGSGTRSEFEAALRGEGLALENLKIALELPSNEAVRGAVEAGLGIAALSELVAGESLASGRLVRLAYALPAREFNAIHDGGRYLSHAAQAFLDFTGGAVKQAR